MVKVALYVTMEAKPEKVAEVESFLQAALPLAQKEHETTAWFAIRLGPTTFGIFDAFPTESGRQAHLKGEIARALMAKASDLLSEPPIIRETDVLASKLP